MRKATRIFKYPPHEVLDASPRDARDQVQHIDAEQAPRLNGSYFVVRNGDYEANDCYREEEQVPKAVHDWNMHQTARRGKDTSADDTCVIEND
jgi:hypothetical protein